VPLNLWTRSNGATRASRTFLHSNFGLGVVAQFALGSVFSRKRCGPEKVTKAKMCQPLPERIIARQQASGFFFNVIFHAADGWPAVFNQ